MSIAHKVRWFSRRAFLGGASSILVLPALESLGGKKAHAQVAAPKRFLAWYFACGVPSIGEWKPSAAGANYPLPALLSSLEPVKSKVSVLSGLRNVGNGPDHTFGTAAFLTGRLINRTGQTMGGPSIDQVIADKLQTPIHSMQLAVKDNVCEQQDICTFLNNVSYGNTGTALTRTMDPVAAFNRLFMGTNIPASDAAALARIALRKSVLDVVNADATSLAKLLSAKDKLRLDEYMTSVRRVEQQIVAPGTPGAGMTCAKPAGLPGVAGLDTEIDAFTEVMALAFECDLTRVITFMAASGATAKSNLTTGDGYHLDITHRADPGWQAKFRSVVTWEVSKFAKLVARLESKKDLDGKSILDNTAAFFSSEISDGMNHNHTDMPVLLAGGLGGGITPGQHRVFAGGEYFADLFMHIAKQMGVTLPAFGSNGTGKITQL